MPRLTTTTLKELMQILPEVDVDPGHVQHINECIKQGKHWWPNTSLGRTKRIGYIQEIYEEMEALSYEGGMDWTEVAQVCHQQLANLHRLVPAFLQQAAYDCESLGWRLCVNRKEISADFAKFLKKHL